MSKYTCNENYFKQIDNPDKAYWLGFLYADGCVNCQYRNGRLKAMNLELGLSIKDKKHLEKFLESLESDNVIRYKKTKCDGKIYESCRINICNTNLCRDLIKLGCVPRKTYDLSFPSYEIIPKKYMRDFLRGFFDGDGCISISEMLGKPHIFLTLTGMSTMLQSVVDFLVSEKIVRTNIKVVQDKRQQNTYNVYFHGIDSVKEILDYLYKDSKLYLDRKYDSYIDFYKDYDEKENKRGVYFNKRYNKYVASICVNRQTYHLGYFDNIDDAIKVRKEAEIEKMNYLNCPLG